MASALDTAEQTIESRIKTMWAASDNTKVIWADTPEDPPATGTWIAPEITWGAAGISTKNGRNQMEGRITVGVYGRPGKGWGPIFTAADHVRDMLNGVEVSPMRFGIPSGPRVVPTLDQQWLRAILTVPFAVEEVVAFSPTDIPGLQLWLKADAITGLNDGDPVVTWLDSSGNGNDVTQGTPAARPLWIDNTLNGKPVVRFDGTDDYLETTSPPTGFHNNTLLWVAAPRVALVTNDGIVCWAATGVNDWDDVNGTSLHEHVDRHYRSDRRVGVNQLVSAASGAESLVINTFGVLTRTMSGTACLYRLNGASSGAGDTYSDANAMTPTRLGLATRYVPGPGAFGQLDFAEVLLYTALLSDAQIVQVEDYLLTRYALP